MVETAIIEKSKPTRIPISLQLGDKLNRRHDDPVFDVCELRRRRPFFVCCTPSISGAKITVFPRHNLAKIDAPEEHREKYRLKVKDGDPSIKSKSSTKSANSHRMLLGR